MLAPPSPGHHGGKEAPGTLSESSGGCCSSTHLPAEQSGHCTQMGSRQLPRHGPGIGGHVSDSNERWTLHGETVSPGLQVLSHHSSSHSYQHLPGLVVW